MRNGNMQAIVAALLVVTGAAFGQGETKPKLAFEVASVKPAAPIDIQKLAQQMMQGGGEMPKIGPHVDGAQAEYTYMALRELIVTAYKVKPYQITGPDWLANTRFDIKAKMPDGSKKDDAPEMLQSLLEDRFRLVVRRETKEHPVLALVVGKGGPKLKAAEPAKAIDENAPLQPGETKSVQLPLAGRSLGYWNPATHGWVVEPGKLELRVGGSSADIRLKRTVNLAD